MVAATFKKAYAKGNSTHVTVYDHRGFAMTYTRRCIDRLSPIVSLENVRRRKYEIEDDGHSKGNRKR
eukprot:scaffold1783_cov71-Attheya_sp.AAC.1